MITWCRVSISHGLKLNIIIVTLATLKSLQGLNKSQVPPHISLSIYIYNFCIASASFTHELVSQVWNQVLRPYIRVNKTKPRLGQWRREMTRNRTHHAPSVVERNTSPSITTTTTRSKCAWSVPIPAACSNSTHDASRIAGATRRRRRSRNPHNSACSSNDATVAERRTPSSTAWTTTTPCNRDTSAWTRSLHPFQEVPPRTPPQRRRRESEFESWSRRRTTLRSDRKYSLDRSIWQPRVQICTGRSRPRRLRRRSELVEWICDPDATTGHEHRPNAFECVPCGSFRACTADSKQPWPYAEGFAKSQMEDQGLQRFA